MKRKYLTSFSRFFVFHFLGTLWFSSQIVSATELFRPTHYDLTFRVILDDNEEPGLKDTLLGHVKIVGEILADTNNITLMAPITRSTGLSVNLSSVQVNFNGQSIPITTSYKESQLAIQLQKEDHIGGQLELEMEFTKRQSTHYYDIMFKTYNVDKLEKRENERVAILNLNNHFRRGTFEEEGYASDTELTYCSYVFPCVDNKSYKSTFNITIIRKEKYMSTSNSKLISSTPDPQYEGWVIDKYEQTIPIAAGFISFVVGDFKYVEKQYGTRNKTVRVLAPSWDIEKIQYNYIADSSSKLLTFYENYFNSTSHLEKMDLIIAPIIGSESVKTWGLIYLNTNQGRNSMLWWEPPLIPKANDRIQYDIFKTIAGNLADQWIGAFWNADMEPNSERSQVRSYLIRFVAFSQLDPRLGELEILQGYMDNPASPNMMLRMINEILAEEGQELARGIQAFAKNVTSGKLTRSSGTRTLARIAKTSYDEGKPSKFPLKEILENQNGNVLVRLKIHNETHVALSQEKFPCECSKNMCAGEWVLPIHIQVGKEEHWVILEPRAETPTFLALNTSEQVVVVDPMATGPYRVFYEGDLLLRIVREQEKNVNFVSSLATGRLLIDQLALLHTGSIEKYLSCGFTIEAGAMAFFLEQEKSIVVWERVLENLDKKLGIHNKFLAHPDYYKVESFFATQIDSLQVGIENEPESEFKTIITNSLHKIGCKYRTTSCGELVSRIFSLWQKNRSVEITRFRSEFIGIRPEDMECYVVAYGGKIAFDFMLGKFTRGEITGMFERNRLHALACAREPELVNKYVSLILDRNNSKLNSNSGMREAMLEDLIRRQIGRIDVLGFLLNYFDEFSSVFGKRYERVLLETLKIFSEMFCTMKQLQKMQDFVEFHKDKLGINNDNQLAKLWERTIHGRYAAVTKKIGWMETTGNVILQMISEIQTRTRGFLNNPSALNAYC